MSNFADARARQPNPLRRASGSNVSVPKETGHGLVCLSANCGWRKSLPSRHSVPPAAPIPVGRQISRAGQSLVGKAGYELPNSRLEVERAVVRSRKFSPHRPPRRFWRALGANELAWSVDSSSGLTRLTPIRDAAGSRGPYLAVS
jgi:hypothetical protein